MGYRVSFLKRVPEHHRTVGTGEIVLLWTRMQRSRRRTGPATIPDACGVGRGLGLVVASLCDVCGVWGSPPWQATQAALGRVCVLVSVDVLIALSQSMLPHTGLLLMIAYRPLDLSLLGLVLASARFMVSYFIVSGELLHREVVDGKRAVVPGQQR